MVAAMADQFTLRISAHRSAAYRQQRNQIKWRGKIISFFLSLCAAARASHLALLRQANAPLAHIMVFCYSSALQRALSRYQHSTAAEKKKKKKAASSKIYQRNDQK